MSGSEANRQWMASRGLWSEHEGVASGAEFATDIWLNNLCTAEAPTCVPEVGADWQCHNFQGGQNQAWCDAAPVQDCFEYRANDKSEAMKGCGPCDCCKKKVDKLPEGAAKTCCVLFNDLFLNYTVTPDLSKCSTTPQTLTTSAGPTSDITSTNDGISTTGYVESTTSTGNAGVASSSSSSTSSASSTPQDPVTSTSPSSSTSAVSSTPREAVTTTSQAPCAGIEEVRVTSAGHSDGDTAMFSFDGVPVPLVAARGLNVVVLGQDGSVVTKESFDTGWQGNGSLPFAALIDELPPNTPVLVAAKDDATDSLSSLAKEALQSLGAAGSILYRGSYALIGIKGGTALAESASASGDGSVEVVAHDIFGNGCGTISSTLGASSTGASNVISIQIKSAGHVDGDFAEFYLNDNPVAMTSGRGLNVVILDQAGSFVSSHSFDTGYQGEGSGPFATLIDELADGMTVLVAAKDDATDGLTQAAKLALKSLGAINVDDISYRGSYALVGIKGGQSLAEGYSLSGNGPVRLATELRSNGGIASSATPSTSTPSTSRFRPTRSSTPTPIATTTRIGQLEESSTTRTDNSNLEADCSSGMLMPAATLISALFTFLEY